MPKTLLLADDSVVIQKLVGLSFANEDVTLVTTDNGDDAIAKARECGPDVVLADVVMPGCSGYEVCEAIKGDPALAHVPVILLTGTFEAFDEARAEAAGSNGHITKPFEAQALVERVNELLAAAPAAKPAPAPTLEVFDGAEEAPAVEAARPAAPAPASTGRDVSLGHDVTTAAEPALDVPAAMPGAPGRPAAADPLASGTGYGLSEDRRGLPPLTDSDPLVAPLPPEESAGDDGEHTIALMPEMAEDDLFATPDPASATVTHMPFEASDATPPLDDATPPPAAERAGDPLGDPASLDAGLDAAVDLGASGDPSLTTIIMSEGDTSSDDVSLGEAVAPVRSLDGPPAAAAGGETMLADDLFAEPAATEDSDSGFDFGDAEPIATPTPRATGSDRDRDPLLADDALSAGPARGFAPEVAGRYDVSTSELVEPAESARTGADPLLDADPAEDEIALHDGLLAEPIPARPAERLPDPVHAPVTLPDPPSAAASVAPASLASAAPAGLDSAAPAGAPSIPDPAGSGAASSATPATGPASTGGPDITPVMRDRIHDTLERVAWEALADLNETLVKQVVERVESIAWEVIPQMAEALVKEEIRRMKGEDE